MRAALIALLLTLTLLAGCSGKGRDGDRLELADGSTVELGAGTSDTTGAIAGYIVDAAIRPLAGAEIATLDGAHVTATDAKGFFLLGGLEPGFYALEARLLGFLPVQSSADVVAGETATVRVQLAADVKPQPYHQTYAFDAFMVEWATIGQFLVEVVADDLLNDTSLCDCSYDVAPATNVTGIVFEAFWEAAAPDPLQAAEYYWEVGDANLDYYETGYCTSPCRVELPLDGYVDGTPLEVRITGPDTWVAFQQQVHLYTTVFHHGPVPAGWSITAPTT